MINSVVKTMLVHPATRSNNFVDKSFTENIVANIIKVASLKDKFVIDDNTKSIIESEELDESSEVLKMVISGYYAEVPISEITQGTRYFYLKREDLNAKKESGFSGVKELQATEENGNQYFVHKCDEDGLVDAGLLDTDDYVIDVFPHGFNTGGDFWSQVNIYLRKSYFTQFFIIAPSAPENQNVLWINSNKSYVMNVYDENVSGWVEIGAVYKTTSTTE